MSLRLPVCCWPAGGPLLRLPRSLAWFWRVCTVFVVLCPLPVLTTLTTPVLTEAHPSLNHLKHPCGDLILSSLPCRKPSVACFQFPSEILNPWLTKILSLRQQELTYCTTSHQPLPLIFRQGLVM